MSFLFLGCLACLAYGWSYWEVCGYLTEQGKVSLVTNSMSAPNCQVGLSFNDSVEEIGWAELRVAVSPSSTLSADEQMFLAGFLEGYASAERISQAYALHAHNAWSFDPAGPVPSKLAAYMDDNIKYTWQFAAGSGDLAQSVGLVASHVDGQVAGMAANASVPALSRRQLVMLHAAGDLEDLVGLLEGTPVLGRGLDCSMLIKATPDGDLALGHTTWRSYGLMLRALKRYDLALGPKYNSHMLVSSTPGFGMVSKDDWYAVWDTDASLLVGETTMSVLNASLYDGLTPNVLLTWVRTVASNLAAKSGKQWTRLFAQHISFSYNNGWAIADLTVPHLAKDSLWYVEQMPRMAEAGDISDILRRDSYLGFYNVPYFQHIRDVSGYTDAERKKGAEYSYWNCTRALMFAKLQRSIAKAPDVGDVLRYNDYLHDPLSKGDPALAISSRYDLRSSKPAAFGGLDAKVSSRSMMSGKVGVKALSGPTTSHGLPPFSWNSPLFNSTFSVGLPVTFDFGFVNFY